MTRYFWKQCYEMSGEDVHWALCDEESEKEGRVSCGYMVLLASYPTCSDGQPLSEQPMPKRIVELLNKAEADRCNRATPTV